MVSRLFVAGRPLAKLMLLVCLFSLLAFPPVASARVVDTIRDGHEGDPGDGVLSPAPKVVPEPTPKDNIFPVFTITMVRTDNNVYLPVFELVGISGAPWLSNWPMQEGSFYNAP